jgi:phosphoribosyl-AMP cyclohydrolase
VTLPKVTAVDGAQRSGSAPATDVAVGVLVQCDAQGRECTFLLTSRPPGKVYAGYWEYPGGKFEPGETVEQALSRELHEELGITIGTVHPWRQELFDYPHARVRLHFCKVYDWQGEIEMREGQAMAWCSLPVGVSPVLPGTMPVLQWFAQEWAHVGPLTLENSAQAPGYTAPMNWLDDIKWDADGLVPAIAQEASSGDVLMVAWMNREALSLTAQKGQAVYWSRSRGRLWHKGEESGHVQQVQELRLDCDGDVILLKVTQLGHDPGIACHTGRHSCFYSVLREGRWEPVDPVLKDPDATYR